MASSRGLAEFVAEQAGATARPMFGEFGLYSGGVLVALFCDDRLFLKPTGASHADPELADMVPPYPGAKPHLVVPAEVWDDGERLTRLFRETAAALPPPRPKPSMPKSSMREPSRPGRGAPKPAKPA